MLLGPFITTSIIADKDSVSAAVLVVRLRVGRYRDDTSSVRQPLGKTLEICWSDWSIHHPSLDLHALRRGVREVSCRVATVVVRLHFDAKSFTQDPDWTVSLWQSSLKQYDLRALPAKVSRRKKGKKITVRIYTSLPERRAAKMDKQTHRHRPEG